jgi:hypothetical protein
MEHGTKSRLLNAEGLDLGPRPHLACAAAEAGGVTLTAGTPQQRAGGGLHAAGDTTHHRNIFFCAFWPLPFFVRIRVAPKDSHTTVVTPKFGGPRAIIVSQLCVRDIQQHI